MSTRDVFKSFLRGVAGAASEQARKLSPLGALQKLATELRARRVVVRPELLTTALARADYVESVMVKVAGDAVRVDAFFTDGAHVAVGFVPAGTHFAPHGAKELLLRVDPPELAGNQHARDLGAAVCAAIGRTLWGAVLDLDARAELPIVDRDGDVLRVDLRTMPEAREARGQAARTLIDTIDLESMLCEEGELRLVLRLPGMPTGG